MENTAAAAVATAQRLPELFRRDQARLQSLGRSGPSVRLANGALRCRPLTSNRQLKELSGLSFPTAGKAIDALVELGIARAITGPAAIACLPTTTSWRFSVRAPS